MARKNLVAKHEIFQKEKLVLSQYEFPKKYLITLDVYKAYDFVNIDLLNNWILNDINIPYDAKEEWIEELKDLNALNFDVSGNIIYRTQGLPQGSELSPYLFNYYITRILEDDRIRNLFDEDMKVTIYADNIIIVSKKPYLDNLLWIVLLNAEFSRFNFSFKEDFTIEEIKGVALPNNINLDMKELEGNKTKILGFPISFYQNYFTINTNAFKFTLKYRFSGIPYKMIMIAKKFIIPKYRFYHTLLYVSSTKEAMQQYVEWFKSRLRFWLMRTIVTVKIPDEMLEYLIGEKESYKILQYGNVINTYSFWFTYFTEFFNEDVNNHEIINKLVALANLMWLAQTPLTTKSIKEIIFSDKPIPNRNSFINYELYPNKNMMVKSFKTIDRLYNCFIADKNPFIELYDHSKYYELK